jgi:hypothetical protein
MILYAEAGPLGATTLHRRAVPYRLMSAEHREPDPLQFGG